MRHPRYLAILACLAMTALCAQTLSLTDRYKEQRGPWEAQLAAGDAASVRRGVEGLLAKEGMTVSPSEYNDMHSLVALQGLAARACISEGDWEAGIEHLQKAQQVAKENLAAVEPRFEKMRAEYEPRIKASKDAIAQFEPSLKALDELPGLTQEQIKQRQQLKIFLGEHRTALLQNEQNLKAMDDMLVQFKKDDEVYTKAVADWQAFLAKEKSDIAEQGGVAKYVSAKVAQVKADDALPKADRLAFARRLQHLDPSNKDVQRLVNGLLGREESSAKPGAKKKPKKAA